MGCTFSMGIVIVGVKFFFYTLFGAVILCQKNAISNRRTTPIKNFHVSCFAPRKMWNQMSDLTSKGVELKIKVATYQF